MTGKFQPTLDVHAQLGQRCVLPSCEQFSESWL
jgi:hypothetical protein